MTYHVMADSSVDGAAVLLLSIAAAARLLGASPRALRVLAKQGDLRLVRFGRRCLVPRSEVDRIAAGRSPAARERVLKAIGFVDRARDALFSPGDLYNAVQSAALEVVDEDRKQLIEILARGKS